MNRWEVENWNHGCGENWSDSLWVQLIFWMVMSHLFALPLITFLSPPIPQFLISSSYNDNQGLLKWPLLQNLTLNCTLWRGGGIALNFVKTCSRVLCDILTLLSLPSSIGSYKSLILTNLQKHHIFSVQSHWCCNKL